jgi:hypothetical protein
LVAVIDTVLVATVLVRAPVPSLLASLTCQLIVRLGRLPVAVGLSLLELKLTARRAASYWATVAVPLRVNTPVVLL